MILINGQPPEPDDSVELLTELVNSHSYLTVEQSRRVALALVSFAVDSGTPDGEG